MSRCAQDDKVAGLVGVGWAERGVGGFERWVVGGAKEARGVGGLGFGVQEFDAVEVDDFAADDSGYLDGLFFAGRTKGYLDFAFEREVSGGEEIHAVVAQVEGGAFDARFAREYLDGNGDPLPGGPSLIGNRGKTHGLQKLYRTGRVAKITEGQGREVAVGHVKGRT